MAESNWNKFVRRGQTIMLIVAGLIILYLSECRIPAAEKRGYKACMEEKPVKSDTVFKDTGRVEFDSIPVPVLTTLPGTHDTIIDTLPILIPTDTAAILADYFLERKYENDYDTNQVKVEIKETVSHNRIVARKVSIQNLRETSIENTIENPPRNKILLGAFAGGDAEGFEFGPSLAWLGKRDNLYQYSYSVPDEGHRVTFMFKLSLRGNR